MWLWSVFDTLTINITSMCKIICLHLQFKKWYILLLFLFCPKSCDLNLGPCILCISDLSCTGCDFSGSSKTKCYVGKSCSLPWAQGLSHHLLFPHGFFVSFSYHKYSWVCVLFKVSDELFNMLLLPCNILVSLSRRQFELPCIREHCTSQ